MEDKVKVLIAKAIKESMRGTYQDNQGDGYAPGLFDLLHAAHMAGQLSALDYEMATQGDEFFNKIAERVYSAIWEYIKDDD